VILGKRWITEGFEMFLVGSNPSPAAILFCVSLQKQWFFRIPLKQFQTVRKALVLQTVVK
jgi:hypothetical protein